MFASSGERMPPCGVPVRVSSRLFLGEDAGLEERLDQPQHALVLNSHSHPVHQGRVVDRVEARFDVRVQDPAVAVGAVEVDLSDRVVCPPQRPEAVGDRLEVGLEDRLQHQLEGCLDHPVGDGRDAELADLPAAAGLGDLPFTHRKRAELTRFKYVPKILQKPIRANLPLDVDGGEAVHSGRSAPPCFPRPVRTPRAASPSRTRD